MMWTFQALVDQEVTLEKGDEMALKALLIVSRNSPSLAGEGGVLCAVEGLAG